MSQAVSQFIDLVRKAAEVSHWIHCPLCGKLTNHILATRGDWEYLTCPNCGNVKQYKVR
jgi:uncharacterized Zn finger protein